MKRQIQDGSYNIRIVVKDGCPRLGFVTRFHPNNNTMAEDADGGGVWKPGNRAKMAQLLEIEAVGDENT